MRENTSNCEKYDRWREGTISGEISQDLTVKERDEKTPKESEKIRKLSSFNEIQCDSSGGEARTREKSHKCMRNETQPIGDANPAWPLYCGAISSAVEALGRGLGNDDQFFGVDLGATY